MKQKIKKKTKKKTQKINYKCNFRFQFFNSGNLATGSRSLAQLWTGKPQYRLSSCKDERTPFNSLVRKEMPMSKFLPKNDTPYCWTDPWLCPRSDRWILDVSCPVNRGGSNQDETKCMPTTSKFLIHYLQHIPPLTTWRKIEKMKLNEPGRLGRYREAL